MSETAPALQEPTAPATFLGYLECNSPGLQQSIELWNLIEEIPGHPEGSTVSRRTLEKAGFVVPPPPVEPPAPPCEPAFSLGTDIVLRKEETRYDGTTTAAVSIP